MTRSGGPEKGPFLGVPKIIKFCTFWCAKFVIAGVVSALLMLLHVCNNLMLHVDTRSVVKDAKKVHFFGVLGVRKKGDFLRFYTLFRVFPECNFGQKTRFWGYHRWGPVVFEKGSFLTFFDVFLTFFRVYEKQRFFAAFGGV